MKMPKQKLWIFYLCPFCCLCVTQPVIAQISPDRTLPTEVIDSGDTIEIIGGSRKGDNLFHSFAEFSVLNGSTAYFQNSSDISNIISRVTGQSISNIDGILKTNGNANLFLINPNGIVFGANAQLDLGGSFLATTANSIKFADGTQFSATYTQTPLLTVSIPVGLQFGNSVSSIVNRSVASPDGKTNFVGIPVGLEVANDRTIALVGGDVTFESGNLTTLGGRIELGSVDANSFVSLLPTEKGWEFGYEGVENFRDIQLLNASFVDVSGAGGIIKIKGKNITLTNTSSLVNFTLAKKGTGNITLFATDSVELSGSSIFSQVGIDSDTFVRGDGGDINIEAEHFTISDGGVVSSGTNSKGNAGNITINASESVEVIGTDSQTQSLLTTSTNGKGKGGELNINTKYLTIADGGQIAASTPAGLGKGGSININASESLELSGFQQLADENIVYSGLSASAGERNSQIQPTKNSGNLKIDTEQLTVRDGAEMTASNFGTGKGGNLTINASSVLLENDATLNAATRSGKGGNIKLENVDILVLQNRAQITTSADDRGNGGNLFIDADTLTLLDSSRIAAEAVQGKGGVIQIETQGLFQSSNSKVTAASEVGLDGIVQIERPGIDSNQAITELPETIIDVRGSIANNCSGEDFAENRFTLIGRGGLPLESDRAIGFSTVQEDLGDFGTTQLNSLGQDGLLHPKETTPSKKQATNLFASPTTHPIVEAQRWFKNTDGKIVLVGNNPIVSDRNFSSNSLACNVR